MAKDQSLWYGHNQLSGEVSKDLQGYKHVTPLRCETSLGHLKGSIRRFDEKNPGSKQSLAIPFLYERGGKRNHFLTIFREVDQNGKFNYIIQDSNGTADYTPQEQEEMKALKNALANATPGGAANATVVMWDKKQQTDSYNCGPWTYKNLIAMADAKEKSPNTPLTPEAISTKWDMAAVRKKHGFKPMDSSPEEGLSNPEENRNQAGVAGGAASANGTVTNKQMWDSVKDFWKKLLDPTKTTFISGVLGLGFDALLWVMTKEPKKKVTPLPVPEDEPAAPEKSGGSSRVLEGTAKRLAEQVKKLPLGLENAKEVGSPESHTAKVGTPSSKSNNQVGTAR